MPTPTTKPHPNLWLADPTLARVRAGQVELKPGAKDGAAGGAVSKAQNALGHWGRTAPTVFVAKSTEAVEVFWHEICHALLDTPLGAKDHEPGTITTEKPDSSTRQARITDAQYRTMRATARTLG